MLWGSVRPFATGGVAARRAPVVPPGVRAVGISLASLSLIALAFALLRPLQVVPYLRPAPPLVLRDAEGRVMRSADLAGAIAIFQISALRCAGPCDDGHAALQALQRRLEAAPPAVRVNVVTIVLDGIRQPAAFRRLSNAMGAGAPWWHVASADPASLKTAVGSGFGVYYAEDATGRISFEPTTILVDERGIVRVEYRTTFDLSHLDRDLRLVVREASTHGAARAAYAAAHLFLCYPR